MTEQFEISSNLVIFFMFNPASKLIPLMLKELLGSPNGDSLNDFAESRFGGIVTFLDHQSPPSHKGQVSTSHKEQVATSHELYLI